MILPVVAFVLVMVGFGIYGIYADKREHPPK